MEPVDSNVLMWEMCEIDTFYYWISEEKKNGTRTFLWLKCAIKTVEHLRESKNKIDFYYKYDKYELDKLFERLEKRINDHNHIDTEFQTSILLKCDWPVVRTKQDLRDEDKPVHFYGNSGKNLFM